MQVKNGFHSMIKSVVMFDRMSHSSLSFGPILVHLSFAKDCEVHPEAFEKNKLLHYKTRWILQILVWEQERQGCRWGRWIKESKKKNALCHRLNTFYSDLYRCSYNEVLTYTWDVLVILKQTKLLISRRNKREFDFIYLFIYFCA